MYLHGAYEYIRFDLVEDCDERWPSLGGFDIPLRYFHIGLQHDLRVTYDMTRRDYGHEMEPMKLSLSIESRNSPAGEIAESVDNPIMPFVLRFASVNLICPYRWIAHM